PVKIDYRVYAGSAQTRFLNGLAEGRLLGQRCPECKKVYLPPRGACPRCGVATEEEVECADTGTVTTFCIVNLPFSATVRDIPYVCASVLLDGADIPLFGLIQEVEVEQVRMGMRVRAVWADPEDMLPTLETIKYFKPSGESDAPYESYREHL
ncbi:MAG: Zn-ribbon domain-containing OB-fold protein, partial [Candidatus Binatia bacterium]